MSSGDRADFGRIQGHLPAYSEDATDPLKIGGHAWAGLPTPTSTGKVINTWHDLYGRIITQVGGPPEVQSDTVGPKTVQVGSTTDTTVVDAPGSGSSIRVSSVYCSNLDPTFSFSVSLKSAGVVRLKGKLHLDGGGFVCSFEPNGWVLPNNVAMVAVLSGSYPATGAQVNVMYKVIPTP